MGLFKLFKKKDEYGVLEFLANAKKIQAEVNKFSSQKVEMKMSNVQKVINDVKLLYAQIKIVEQNLKNADIDDKKRDMTLKLLVSKFEEVRGLYNMVINYEKQLHKYDELGNDI